MENADHTETHEGGSSFEDVYRKLEETVHSLEEGNLTLAESTSLFEEGIRLAGICNDILNATELRISKLGSISEKQGQFTENDME